MKVAGRIHFLQKLVTVLGLVSAGVMLNLPVGAQGALNPHPSIFNEPPYNRGSGNPTPVTTPPATPSPNQPPTGTQANNIVAVLATNGSFKTLSRALAAAGLDQTLQGAGPFTIFAPTDRAFAQLPPDALRQLLQPQNKDLLVKILSYHVVSGKLPSTDLKSGSVPTVEGSPIQVKVGTNGVMVNNAQVIQADIPASNGVIHVIDQVMLPRDLQQSGGS